MSRPNLGSFTLVVSQKPTGGSKEVGGEYMNAINIGPMSYRRIMDKRNNLQRSLVASRDPFLLLSRPKLGSYIASYKLVAPER